MKLFSCVLIFICSHGLAATPDWEKTPGAICSEKDRDFEKYDYPEQVARCQRHVTKGEKRKVADSYGGIPESEWSNYEFDHLIPLCVGGSNAIENIWPEPLIDAQEKDKIEGEVCRGMKAGTLSQKKAIEKIISYFEYKKNLGDGNAVF